MKSKARKSQLIRLSFFISLLLMGLKFVAYFITQSTAILTDAVESIVNVVASGFAFYSIWLANQPKDEDHPYGHGKIEFFSAGVEGVLILLAGVYILGQSIYSFFSPKVISDLPLGLLLLSIASVANGVLGWYLRKEGKRMDSLTLYADGKHLLTDFYSSLVLLLGVVLIYFTNQFWLDSALSLGFSLFILYNGYQLIRSSVSGLMDESDKESLQKIANIMNASRKPSWIDIHNMRVLKYGADLHVDCHVTLPYYFTLEQVHEELHELEEQLQKNINNELEIFTHADPCIPELCCRYCRISDCSVRQSAYTEDIEWNLGNLAKNQKHYYNLNTTQY
ncbi:cation diffusion facilitator family transporter [Cytophagales bacterium LB-30]|uniref:Cation diffusion facilitator family transporter n=1 Tax=Shiella aurantiaca TaxID=3058365 RepID=A0ABT8F1D5_9BACT|nr:cation diffusion facilitator family transporter [Shiella aurantiaca]MDN4164266.1 cation diffusion facilitator family transporter [Shiella aurantiaca]